MQLYPYQEQGVSHLLSMPFSKPHALLADAPGTGKTPMSITAAKTASCKGGIILCPAIIKPQWLTQMHKWGLADPEEVQIAYGYDYKLTKAPWLVLNYDLVRQPEIFKQINEREWDALFMDEAQRLKGLNTQQSLAVFHKDYGIANHCYWKWALSGTIVPNRPIELFPLLFTMVRECLKPYDNERGFVNRFCGGIAMDGRGASNETELAERIRPYMLSRTLESVGHQMPPLIENEVFIDVPFDLHPDWAGSGFMQDATERRLVAEAKAPFVADYISDRLESGVDKIVVFTYHENVINGLARLLDKYNPALIYGGVNASNRLLAIERFTNDAACRVFLGQIGSMGEGLDRLQYVASECVEAEPEWSPGREDQAIARLMRLGQTRPVIVSKLFAKSSYEDRIRGSNLRKRRSIEIITKPNGGDIHMSLESDVKKLTEAINAVAPALQAIAASLAKSNGEAPAQTAFAPPALVLVPAAQAAPVAPPVAPVAAPPAVTLPNLPTLPAPAGVVAAPAVTVPAPAAAPATGEIATLEQFQEAVFAPFKAQGNAGIPKLTAFMQANGVQQLAQVPQANWASFLAGALQVAAS